MRPDLLKLPDRDLAGRMHKIEELSGESEAPFVHFQRLRTELSREAWQSITSELGCDQGPMAETGVMVFPLDQDIARRLLRALLAGPRARMRRKDFALGYVGTSAEQCDYLNSCNHYHALTPASRALLAQFLSMVGPTVEKAIGHPFRIASTRQFELVPNRPQADRHLDGWPVAMRKLFVLPQGCGKQLGTTWFRRRDGVEITLESEKPIWMLFENSVVLHAPIPGEALRPTIEFDLVPARQTSLDPFDAGLGGWYPTFPTEAELLAATRLALQRYFDETPGGAPSPGWLRQLRVSLRGK